MNAAPADSAPKLPGEAGQDEPKPARAGWSPTKLMVLILLVLAAQLAFIVVFGTKKPIVPRAVARVPHLQLAERASELIALDDPTLFALPHANDYATAFWQRPPDVTAPSFRWTAPTNWLLPKVDQLGAAFRQFMQTNSPAKFGLNFKPPPPFAEFLPPVMAVRPPNSRLEITGDLAQRHLLKPINLPPLIHNDVIVPSRIQVLVERAGTVVSAVILPSENSREVLGRWEPADTNALAIALTARFAPAAQLTVGELIFNWQTLPAAATNATAIP